MRNILPDVDTKYKREKKSRSEEIERRERAKGREREPRKATTGQSGYTAKCTYFATHQPGNHGAAPEKDDKT